MPGNRPGPGNRLPGRRTGKIKLGDTRLAGQREETVNQGHTQPRNRHKDLILVPFFVTNAI
jgi:hypothetical protein